MNKVNVVLLFNRAGDQILMCHRRKEPYKGLFNLVGGKVEPGEGGLAAAYRELEEETGVTRELATLHHLMDFVYHYQGIELQVYVGGLREEVAVSGDENPLYWFSLDNDFSNRARFAGDGNIALIVEHGRQFMEESSAPIS